MPGTVVGTSLNIGYKGKVSRNPMNKINARFVKSILDGNGAETLSAIPFGHAVVTNVDNTYSKFGQTGAGVTAAAAASFAGVAVAEVKQVMSYAYGANDTGGVYEPLMPCDVLQVGTLAVECKEGTVEAGGAVYIMTVAGTYAAIGEFVATSSPTGQGATAVELPQCKWVSGKISPSTAGTTATKIAEMTIMNAVAV